MKEQIGLQTSPQQGRTHFQETFLWSSSDNSKEIVLLLQYKNKLQANAWKKRSQFFYNTTEKKKELKIILRTGKLA